MWLEDRGDHKVIRHTFYQKETTSPLVFHSRGAHPWRSKIITLSEELRRRLRHMDRLHSIEDKREVLRDYIQKMCDSGYSHDTRMEIIKSGTRKYYRQVLQQETGGQRINRGPEEMWEKRRIKPLLNKSWYRSKRGGTKATAAKDLPFYLLDTQRTPPQETRR